jgi:hypothetical protein
MVKNDYFSFIIIDARRTNVIKEKGGNISANITAEETGMQQDNFFQRTSEKYILESCPKFYRTRLGIFITSPSSCPIITLHK